MSAKLEPAPKSERRAQDQVQTDTHLDMRAFGYGGVLRMGAALRRDVYLPCVLLWAILLAAPIPTVGKVWSLGTGTAVTLGVGVLSSCALVEFVIMTQAPKVYVPSNFVREATHFVFERWLTPPGNRIIAPLLLSGLLVGRWWSPSHVVPGSTQGL